MIECCSRHNKLRPNFGLCSIAIFDGCEVCCDSCPELKIEDEDDEIP
jgi:hypothetical protein